MARAKREAATRKRLGLRAGPEPRILPETDSDPPAQDSSSDDEGEGEGESTNDDQVPAETGDDPDDVDQDGDGTSLEPSSKPPNKKQRRGSSGAKSKSDNDTHKRITAYLPSGTHRLVQLRQVHDIHLRMYGVIRSHPAEAQCALSVASRGQRIHCV